MFHDGADNCKLEGTTSVKLENFQMMRFAFMLLLHIFFTSGALGQVTVAQLGDQRPCASPCRSLAVFFIHGLTGNEATWVNSSTGASFPTLLLTDPQLTGKLDVYSVQYDSLWNEGRPIAEVTEEVAVKIDKLLTTKKYMKVAFVTHSLGGNIVRAYLVHVKSRYGHAALSRFRMLISLGTPSEGSSLAGFANLFSGNQQLRSLIEIQRNDFLQLLQNTQVDYLQKQLNNHCAGIEFDAIYETKPVGLSLIVTRQSATAGATRSAGDGWNKNHLELPKPSNRNDDVYKWVSSELKLCTVGQSRCKDAVDPGPVCVFGDFK